MAQTLSIDTIQKTVNDVVTGYNASDPVDRVRKVALFGSYASGSAHESSDVDLLIEFNSIFVSLFVLGRLLTDFEDALDTAVDIVTLPLPEKNILELDKVVTIYEE